MAEFNDLAGLFGKRYEHRRWNRPAAGVRPAQQGLHASRLTVKRVDDRLIFDVQLVAFSGAGQAARQARLVLGEMQFAQVEDLVVAIAVAFCPVHREVSVVDQVPGRVAVAPGERDTDARVDPHLYARENERFSQRPIKPDGERVSLGGVVEVFAQDDELVAGQARQAVPGPQHFGQARGDGHQQLIADLVTIGVVDRLELVQIHEEHRRRVARAAPALKRVAQALEHQRPVGQAGQCVVQSRFARLVRGVLQIGAGLSVDQICGGDISQRLSHPHRLGGKITGGVAIQVKRPESRVFVVEREREHRRQPGV
ncbi:MAG TPA: hypothetical protein VIK04_13560 [Solirubrobacteraceae bacterium]